MYLIRNRFLETGPNSSGPRNLLAVWIKWTSDFTDMFITVLMFGGAGV